MHKIDSNLAKTITATNIPVVVQSIVEDVYVLLNSESDADYSAKLERLKKLVFEFGENYAMSIIRANVKAFEEKEGRK